MRCALEEDFLLQIAVKFIANLPSQELSEQRIGYHFETAYFYYLDHHKIGSLKNKWDKYEEREFFCTQLLTIVDRPQLAAYTGEKLSKLIEKNYFTISVHGVIILNPEKTKIVLVESTETGTLGFPKGKIREGQTPIECATRESLEEIKINAALNPKDYIEIDFSYSSKYLKETFAKNCYFYLLTMNEECLPIIHHSEKTEKKGDDYHSKMEIKCSKWYSLNEIPALMKKLLINGPTRKGYEKLLLKMNRNRREK